MSYDKQVELLRAWGTASGLERKPVSNKSVAEVAGILESSTFLCNTFFQEMGLLSRGDGGFVASPDVANFANAHKWNDSNAGHKLAPAFRTSWFAKLLLPKLQFRTIEERQALSELGGAAAAGPEYKNQIKTLIDYLELSGLVQRDGTLLKEGVAARDAAPSAAKTEELTATSDPPKPQASTLPAVTTTLPNESTTVSAEALTRLLTQKPPKVVRTAIWTVIQFLTIGAEAFPDEGGEK